MEQIRTYQDTFRVQQNECDFRNEMMAAAFLRRAQQIGIDQCNAVGLVNEVYEKTNTAFLMAKSTIELLQPVSVNERLTVKTIPSAAKRAVYNRIVIFYNEQGEEVAVYDSRWVLVDRTARRILRTPPAEIGVFFTEPAQRELDLSVVKTELSFEQKMIAGYSVCDCNGHINNTRYADLICNFISAQEFESKRIQKMVLLYHKEIPFGAEFELKRGKQAENRIYFTAQAQDKNCMEANVIFESIKKDE